MSEALTLLVGFGCAASVTYVCTPSVIRLALAWGMLDRPEGWKAHHGATPYLGGLAVVAGFSLAGLALGAGSGLVRIMVGGALAFSLVGVLDDRISLPVGHRIAAELGSGALVWWAGYGWSISTEPWNLILTMTWVLAIINAVNLLDLMDGVAAVVASVGAVGASAVSLTGGGGEVAIAGVCLAGACVGFLPFNLARPSRIFLGDGGSMPIGYVTAVLLANAPFSGELGGAALLGGIMLCLVPLGDMGLRILIRLRGRISLATAGPDSVANRLRDHLPSAIAVASVLGGAQAVFGVLAVLLSKAGPLYLLVGFLLSTSLGFAAAIFLHTLAARRKPPGA